MANTKRGSKRAYRPKMILGAVLGAALLAACTSDKSESTNALAGETTVVSVETVAPAETTAGAPSDAGTANAFPDPTIGSIILPNGPATKVVASTTWVAAIAKLAGATDIKVLVPSEANPADYEPTAADLEKLKGAEWVIFEGTEKVAKTMADSAKLPARIDVVSLHHDPATLAAEINDFGALLSTTEAAAANLAAYNQAYKEISDELTNRLVGVSVQLVAQDSVSDWAALAGWPVVETFGPKVPTADAVTNLATLGPNVILEDGHAPLGKAIADASGAKLISLANYPTEDLDIVALVRKNADTIAAAMAP